MGFYAKKTLTGYKKVDGGASEPDAEYYIETAEEHEESLQRVRDAQDMAYRANESAEREKKAVADRADRQFRQYAAQVEADAEKRVQKAETVVAERDERISSLKEEIEELETQLRNAKHLYRNMQRIMKERANQTRGIRPKKEHDGYVVLESRQWSERYTEEVWDTKDHKERYDNDKDRRTALKNGYLRIDHKTADVWKSIIQTPYNSSLPINQIRDRIEEEIGDVLDDINVEEQVIPEYNGAYYNFGTNEEGYERNGMYRWKYRANYRSGLWELEIFTTKSLRVPEYRRPPQKLKGKKKVAEEDIYAAWCLGYDE